MAPYTWDDWSLDGLPEHIHEYEVRQVVESDVYPRWPRPGRDPDTKMLVLAIWSRTDAGRPLIVAVELPRSGTWRRRIVGAREMRADEQAQFEQWEVGRDEQR